jgi:hypothetical protein
MILLWFILGVALIFGIARYNESNKLFWTLLFAYVMGFAGTKMVLQAVDSDEQSNRNLTQVYSTQVPTTNLSAFTYYMTNSLSKESNVVTAQMPVGQSITSELSETEVTLSEVFGRTLIKPPELCLTKDILILHDSG